MNRVNERQETDCQVWDHGFHIVLAAVSRRAGPREEESDEKNLVSHDMGTYWNFSKRQSLAWHSDMIPLQA